MITCTIFWKGESNKNGQKFWIGVNYEVKGFMAKSFVQVTEEKYAEIPEEGEIEIPERVLS